MVNLKDTKPLIKDQGRSLRELAAGLEKAQIFLTAMELNLFTTLEKSKTAAVLAEEMGYDYEVLQKFLDVLVALGLLVREGKRYRTASCGTVSCRRCTYFALPAVFRKRTP